MGAKRVVKTPVQQDWLTATGRRKKDGRGGKRRGAGRPPKGKRAGSPHKKRQAFKAQHPVHVVLRAVPEIGGLRRRKIYQALRWATLTAARREDVRIVHVSIQRTHVHLLVEAEHRTALAKGMQGFQIAAAKYINAAIKDASGRRRKGTVFADRYHAEIITTPRQARHTLAYVMNNWRKHREDREGIARTWNVDPFSTGVLFTGWREREREIWLWKGPETKWPATYEPMVVWLPRTWLLYEGWRRHGLVRFREVPSAAAATRTTRTTTRRPRRTRAAAR